jgi:prepilin-type N-terminal cleavage/methylation domain-containing protein
MNKKGFSLIELIIYMGLLSMLLVILSQVFTSIIQSRLDSESTASIDQDANYLLSRFTYDISRAQGISEPQDYASNHNPSTALTIAVGSDSYRYSVNAGNLQLTNALGTDILNSYNSTISNLLFTRIGNGASPSNYDSIKINFTITSKVTRSSGKEARNYEITVAPK